MNLSPNYRSFANPESPEAPNSSNKNFLNSTFTPSKQHMLGQIEIQKVSQVNSHLKKYGLPPVFSQNSRQQEVSNILEVLEVFIESYNDLIIKFQDAQNKIHAKNQQILELRSDRHLSNYNLTTTNWKQNNYRKVQQQNYILQRRIEDLTYELKMQKESEECKINNVQKYIQKSSNKISCLEQSLCRIINHCKDALKQFCQRQYLSNLVSRQCRLYLNKKKENQEIEADLFVKCFQQCLNLFEQKYRQCHKFIDYYDKKQRKTDPPANKS